MAPHLPRGDQANAASTTTAKDPGAPLNPEEDVEVPGTPTPGRRPGAPPGTNLHTREEDELASPGWKLLEDLGAKKTEAPRGDRDGKGVNPCPPALQKWATAPNPLRRILGREEATSLPKKNPEGFSCQNPSSPKGAPVVSP